MVLSMFGGVEAVLSMLSAGLRHVEHVRRYVEHIGMLRVC